MTSVLAPADAQQILAALVADAPEGRSALEVLRPEVLTHTRAAYDALYRQPQRLPADVLHALAAVTADWQGSGPLAEWHRTQGAQQALVAADPVTHDPALQALRDHVDLLSTSPALVTASDQERLAAAGHEPSTVVLISQLVSFESHLQRLLAGLAALRGADVPSADADAPHPRALGTARRHHAERSSPPRALHPRAAAVGALDRGARRGGAHRRAAQLLRLQGEREQRVLPDALAHPEDHPSTQRARQCDLPAA